MTMIGEKLPELAIISVGHRAELEQFHERKYNLMRKEGGAKLVEGDMIAPPVGVVGMLVKKWRGPRGETTPAQADGSKPAQPPISEKRRAGSKG
jgi:putative ATP-binding cassette transporter